MAEKYLKILLFLFATCLVGAGVFYFSYNWKEVRADLAVGIRADYIKAGAPARGKE